MKIITVEKISVFQIKHFFLLLLKAFVLNYICVFIVIDNVSAYILYTQKIIITIIATI